MSLITTIRQKKQSLGLGINSYLRLAKNAPDRGSVIFQIAGERGKGKGDGETGTWNLEREWSLVLWCCGAVVLSQRSICNFAFLIVCNFGYSAFVIWWNRETVVKVKVLVNSLKRSVFNVFYESTRFYASLTESTRFCWFSSFNPNSTRFLCFNS